MLCVRLINPTTASIRCIPIALNRLSFMVFSMNPNTGSTRIGISLAQFRCVLLTTVTLPWYFRECRIDDGALVRDDRFIGRSTAAALGLDVSYEYVIRFSYLPICGFEACFSNGIERK
jgi:hypothetical protein